MIASVVIAGRSNRVWGDPADVRTRIEAERLVVLDGPDGPVEVDAYQVEAIA